MKKALIFVFVLLLFVSFSIAANFPVAKDKYVNDFGSVLASGDSDYLRGLFYQVENETTAEIVFVSLETINGEDISKYAVDMASEWKVGKADKDNGLFILYVKDIKRIYVATGYGVEGILPDSKVGRLLDENYVPLRDSGNLSEGIVQFSIAVSNVMADNAEEIKSGQASGNREKPIYYFIIAVIIFIIVFSIVGAIAQKTQKKHGNFPWWLIFLMPSGRSSSGFGSSGFGGGGFGGGGAGR